MRSRASALLSTDAVNKAAAAAAAESGRSTADNSPLTSPGVSPRSDGEELTPRRARRSAVMSAQEAGAAWLSPPTTPGVSPPTVKRLSPRPGHESGGAVHPLAKSGSATLASNPSSPQVQGRPGLAGTSGSPRALRSNSTATPPAPMALAALAPRPGVANSASAIPKLQPRAGGLLKAGTHAPSLTASAGALDTAAALRTAPAADVTAAAGARSGRYDNTTVRRTLKPGRAGIGDNGDGSAQPHLAADVLSELEADYDDSDDFLATVALDSDSTSMYAIGPEDTVDMTSEIIIQPRWKSTKPSQKVVSALQTLLSCDDEAFDRANEYFMHARKDTRPELYAAHGQRDAKETFYLANEFATPEEVARLRASTSKEVVDALELLDEQIFARARGDTDLFQSLTSVELHDTMEFVIAAHLQARDGADVAAERTESFERLRDRVWTMTAPPLPALSAAAPAKPVPQEPPPLHDKPAYRDYMTMRIHQRRQQRQSVAPKKPLPPTPDEECK